MLMSFVLQQPVLLGATHLLKTLGIPNAYTIHGDALIAVLNASGVEVDPLATSTP